MTISEARPRAAEIPPGRASWFEPPEWLASRAHRVVMAVLFLGALVAGYYLLPGVSEKVAALEKDGQFRLALRTLEQQYDQGDRRQRILFQMHRLYEQFGDIAGAKRVLEQLVEQRPRDLNLNRQLAALYRQAQDEPGYIATVKAGLKLRYQEASCRDLIGIQHRDGNAALEERQIADCRLLGYDRTEDLIRLAHLQLAAGKTTEASSLLRALDDKRRLDQPRDQLTLFSVLLDANEARDAYRRGLRWFRSNGEEGLALDMIDLLADDDRFDLALEFAKSTGTPGDGISLAIPEMMLDRGQIPNAKELLALWLERAKLDQAALAGRFVDAALVAQDVDLAFTGGQRFGLQKLAQGDLTGLAEALGASGRQADFEATRAYLAPETIAANPLLGAAIALLAGQNEQATQLVAKVDVSDLDEWRSALLSQINSRLGLRQPNAPEPSQPIVAPAPASAEAQPAGPGEPARQADPAVAATPSAPASEAAPHAATAHPKAPHLNRPARPLRTIRRPNRQRAAASRAPAKEQ